MLMDTNRSRLSVELLGTLAVTMGKTVGKTVEVAKVAAGMGFDWQYTRSKSEAELASSVVQYYVTFEVVIHKKKINLLRTQVSYTI